MADREPKHVWEIDGPGRHFDSFIMPGDTDEQDRAALEFAQRWIEELWDKAEVGQPPMSVSLLLRERYDDEFDLEADDD